MRIILVDGSSKIVRDGTIAVVHGDLQFTDRKGNWCVISIRDVVMIELA